MPIYEFICKKCSCRFEKLMSASGDKKASCPECGGEDTQKLLSSFGIGGGSRLKRSSSGCTTCSTKTCSTCH